MTNDRQYDPMNTEIIEPWEVFITRFHKDYIFKENLLNRMYKSEKRTTPNATKEKYDKFQ